jgi:hypothetical protein
MAFSPPSTRHAVSYTTIARSPVVSGYDRTNALFMANNDLDNNEDEMLEKTFGGYTVKQRLREEVESPFRTFRLFFFGFSTASAFLALYFSLISTLKAYTGGFSEAPPLDEALQSVGINVAAAAICGFITFKDWQKGNTNLKRIAKGGQLAKLCVSTADSSTPTALTDFRRNSRVLIAAGGPEYVSDLCRSLNADQRSDDNSIPSALANSDVIVVPVLLEQDGNVVGDTMARWRDTQPVKGVDRNLSVDRSKEVVAFPRGNSAWASYLESEIETAKQQGFDVMSKGFIIIVKKNGKILRRATGQPPWAELLGTMEVLDGTKFGMPGDDEKYGS